MTEIVLARNTALKRLRGEDKVFRILTLSSAVAVLVILGGVIIALIVGAAPAFHAFGPEFLVTESWNPVTERFGAMAPIYGTLITSVIAMVIAVPSV